VSKELTDEILDPMPDGPIKKTREELLSELDEAERPRVYDIKAFGATWSFCFPAKSSVIQNFKGGAAEFAKRMTDRKKLPKPYTDALDKRVDEEGNIVPMDAADFVNAFALHYWSDPEQDGGVISEPQALFLVAKFPGVCSEMVAVIEAAMTDGQILMVSTRLREAKKNSLAITSNDSGLKPQGSITTSIPTNSKTTRKSA
jgi:hypothetical protein